MSKEETTLFVFLIVGGLGAVFTVIGFLIIFLQKRKIHLCQDMTEGKVVDYGYRGNGVIVPVVEYRVFGETYRRKRSFRGYVMKSWKSQEEPFVKVTKNDYLSIAGGRMGKRDAMQMWPLESRMPVYYNPFKPQMSFVEKIPEKLSIVGLVFLLTGVFLIIFSLILFYIMNSL